MDMTDEEYDYDVLREVGKASHEALMHSRAIVKEGRSILEIAQELEGFMEKKGFFPAFPVNISINENAAHYTPSAADPYVLLGSEVVKVDLGARREGYLGDCAITIDLSQEYNKLIEAAETALENAISLVKAGRPVNQIGREIERSVRAAGAFKPIANLGGHGIDKTDLHADIFIPNFDNGDTTQLKEGQVIAIEPFATDGFGLVRDGEHLQIFQKTRDATPRSNELRQISEFIDEKYSTYPFALRWLDTQFGALGEFKIRRAIGELAGLGALESFPVLIERKSGIVAQAEKEMIVQKGGCEIITR